MSADIATEEISREDYTALDKILRRIDSENSKRTSLETFANWKLGFKLFRDLELHFERATDRKPYEDVHRALLTSFLGLTELLLVRIGDLQESDLARISLTKEAFTSCAKYMRQKYN